jgi:hypothetical protein
MSLAINLSWISLSHTEGLVRINQQQAKAKSTMGWGEGQ